MTQILSLISPEFIVQASDRRVTFVPTGRIGEDNHNKAVFFCGHTAWAFTGVASVGATKTAEWMANTVALAHSLQGAIEELRARATRRLHNYPRDIRRLAFVGVGFASQVFTGKSWVNVAPYPILTVVSNFLDEHEHWRAEALDDFSARSWTIPEQRSFLLFESGVPLRAGARTQLVRDLNSAFIHRVRPPAVARLLARAIKSEHASNPTGPVGNNVMCTVVTQDAPSGDPNYSGGLWPLADDAQEADYFRLPAVDPPSKYYFYVPAKPESRIHFGPDSVCVGIQMRNVKMHPVGPPENREWTATAKVRNRTI